MAIDPEFRAKITGSPEEKAYDVSKYKKPENPVLPEYGDVKLASNDEEYLLLELLPTVANGFLKRRRAEEWEKANADKAKAEAAAKSEEKPVDNEPITGEVLSAPMGGKVLEVNFKPGDKVKPGDVILVYEAMKMENDVEAEKEAVIKRIFVKPDDIVGTEAPLVEFE